MAQKEEVYKEKMKQKGHWNYTELYNMLFEWLKDSNYKLSEDLYNEKLQANGKEVIIRWTAGRKITDYFKFQIKLDWHILGMKDAEVEIDGKKVSINKSMKTAVMKTTNSKKWKNLASIFVMFVFLKTLWLEW